jgi:hypothetical protein
MQYDTTSPAIALMMINSEAKKRGARDVDLIAWGFELNGRPWKRQLGATISKE